MPSVESNTKFRCGDCNRVYEGAHLNDRTPCVCGGQDFYQLVITQVCDFCSRQESSEWWTFPCKGFTFTIQFPGQPTQKNRGAWLSCLTCKELIEADNYEALAARSVEHDLERHPDMAGHRAHFLRLAAQTHHDFKTHRTGDPYKEDDDVEDH